MQDKDNWEKDLYEYIDSSDENWMELTDSIFKYIEDRYGNHYSGEKISFDHKRTKIAKGYNTTYGTIETNYYIETWYNYSLGGSLTKIFEVTKREDYYYISRMVNNSIIRIDTLTDKSGNDYLYLDIDIKAIFTNHIRLKNIETFKKLC